MNATQTQTDSGLLKENKILWNMLRSNGYSDEAIRREIKYAKDGKRKKFMALYSLNVDVKCGYQFKGIKCGWKGKRKTDNSGFDSEDALKKHRGDFSRYPTGYPIQDSCPWCYHSSVEVVRVTCNGKTLQGPKGYVTVFQDQELSEKDFKKIIEKRRIRLENEKNGRDD